VKRGLNVGVIGLGHMNMLHLMNCKHIEGVKVTVAAERSKSCSEKSDAHNVPNYVRTKNYLWLYSLSPENNLSSHFE
jgi:predicted homoserine dehydrogenase-like protein